MATNTAFRSQPISPSAYSSEAIEAVPRRRRTADCGPRSGERNRGQPRGLASEPFVPRGFVRNSSRSLSSSRGRAASGDRDDSASSNGIGMGPQLRQPALLRVCRSRSGAGRPHQLSTIKRLVGPPAPRVRPAASTAVSRRPETCELSLHTDDTADRTEE